MVENEQRGGIFVSLLLRQLGVESPRDVAGVARLLAESFGLQWERGVLYELAGFITW